MNKAYLIILDGIERHILKNVRFIVPIQIILDGIERVTVVINGSVYLTG